MREMYKNMGICDEVYDYCDNIIKSLHDRFEEIDKNAEYNQMKVIKAMQDNKVAEMHLSYSPVTTMTEEILLRKYIQIYLRQRMLL